MPEPAFMRIRYQSKYLPGPIEECGEQNLWEIHEFSHEISGRKTALPWLRPHWDTKHKVMKVVLEVGAFLPQIYSVDVDNYEYLNRVEIFWRQNSEERQVNHFYFKHTIYPVKVTAVTMLMPDVKDKRYELYNHLVSVEFRYRYIEHLFVKGYLHNKAEWKYFYTDQLFEPIPEKYLSGRCLSHEALEWEENWKKEHETGLISFEYIDLDNNSVSEDSFHFRHGTNELLCQSPKKQGKVSKSFEKNMFTGIEIICIA